MTKRILLATTLATAVAFPAHAQVTASQAPTPPPREETELCPLQLDVDLTKMASASHRIVDLPAGAAISANTSRFVCDKARVERISIGKEKERPREVLIVVNALLSSGWMRQDVDLTVSLLVNGQVKKSETFRALTIGDPNANWAARSGR
jgi:hypothetical protein